MKQPRRFSLALKVNIVIMAMILTVSVLLILISENTYQKAVFRPYFRKLENAEVPVEELKPIAQEFLPYLGTEEMNGMASISDTQERIDALNLWLLDKPGLDGEPPASTLMNDWLHFDVLMDEIQRIGDLQEIICYEEKNWNRYFISCVRDNNDNHLAISFANIGKLLPDDGPAESNYFSPRYLEEDGKTLLVRSIPLTLENDGQAWFRLSYNLTEELREHRYFLIRSILLTIGVTLLASVITGLVMRRYILNPVRTLAKETKEFVPEEDGTYSRERIGRAEIRSNDEIGDLSRDIRAMQESIVTNTKNLTRMTAERERTNTELEMAAKIQADALPNVFPAFPDHKEFDIFLA
jgi:hypothetical protein